MSKILKKKRATQPQLIRGPLPSPLTTVHCSMGGRPQAASLVQGLRPRNAPLGLPKVLALPNIAACRQCAATCLEVANQIHHQKSLTGGENNKSVKTHTECGCAVTKREINPNLSGCNYTFYPPSLDPPNVRPNHIGPNEAGSLELPPNRLPGRILPPATDFGRLTTSRSSL